MQTPSTSATSRVALAIGVLALVSGLMSASYAAGLAKNSVGTAQLKNGAVTTPKLDDGAVTGAKIKNGAVGAGDLAPGVVPETVVVAGSYAPGTANQVLATLEGLKVTVGCVRFEEELEDDIIFKVVSATDAPLAIDWHGTRVTQTTTAQTFVSFQNNLAYFGIEAFAPSNETTFVSWNGTVHHNGRRPVQFSIGLLIDQAADKPCEVMFEATPV